VVINSSISDIRSFCQSHSNAPSAIVDAANPGLFLLFCFYLCEIITVIPIPLTGSIYRNGGVVEGVVASQQQFKLCPDHVKELETIVLPCLH
jgi:hypothetical protein